MKKLFTFLMITGLMLMSNVGWGQLTESFEEGLPTSYTTDTEFTLSSGVWTGSPSQVLRGTEGVNSGSYSCQLRSQTGAQITTPTLVGGVGTISFYVTASTASGGLQVRISTNDGETWTQVAGSPISFGSTTEFHSFVVNNPDVNKVQFYRTGATVYIDDVEINQIKTDVPFYTNFTIDVNWVSGSSYADGAEYHDSGWSFIGVQTLRNSTELDAYDGSNFYFQNRGDFTITNQGSIVEMTGFTLYLRDWAMTGSRSINLSLNGGEDETEIGVINSDWFDNDEYQAFTYYFSSAQSFDMNDFVVTMTGGSTNATRLRIGGFEAHGFVKWVGEGFDNNWSTPENWSPEGSPRKGNSLFLDNSIESDSYEIVLPAGEVITEIFSVEISPAGEKEIVFVLPNDNTADPGFRITGTGDALIINNGAVFRNATGALSGTGLELSDVGANIRINNGGRYVHNTVRAHAAAIVAKLSTASGTETGIFEFDVPSGTNYTLSISNRVYGSVVLSSESPMDYTGAGGGNLTIRGNLVIGNNVTFRPTLTGEMEINGDLSIAEGGSLVIHPTGKMQVAGNLTNENNGSKSGAGLLIKSDATGTGSLIHNTNDVAATVERYFETEEAWRLVSSPVVNQAVSGNWTPATGVYGYDFYAYDEENEMWLNQKDGANDITHFVPGKGYLVSFESVEYTTPTFVDDLNNGDITIEVTRDSEGDYAGANLIGNPYASGIDWSEAVRTLFEDDFAYVYDATASGGAGAYAEIDGSDEEVDSFIAPHQGFFVIKETGGSSDFTFTNAMRVHGGTFTKQQQMQEALVMRLSGDTYYDQTTLRIRENSAFERDRQDARKFFSYNQQAPQLYSYTSDNIQVSINSIPAINEDATTHLGMRIPADGLYTLSLIEMTGAFGEQEVYLKDTELGIEQNLSEVAVYDFSASAGDLENRFLIHFGALSLDDKRAVTAANAYAIGNTLYVLNARGQTQLEVFDLQGRLLQSQSFKAEGLHSQPINLPAGMYVVRIMDAESVSSTKIIVK